MNMLTSIENIPQLLLSNSTNAPENRKPKDIFNVLWAMRPASLAQIKTELKGKSREELLELCVKLAKFKVLNKEYLTYLIFEEEQETEFVLLVKETMQDMLGTMNTDSLFYMKKTIRKVLRYVKKCIAFSKKPPTEVELLLSFLEAIQNVEPSIFRSRVLKNMYYRQKEMMQKKLQKLHPDMAYDFQKRLDGLI
jgi:hypothetical protein